MKARTTNPELIALVRLLRQKSKENEAKIWNDIAKRLSKSHRNRLAVNLSHLNRYSQKDDTVAVPGKVLSAGKLNHPITITAFAFSTKAVEKISAAKGKCMLFPELIKKNPKGSNVKIVG